MVKRCGNGVKTWQNYADPRKTAVTTGSAHHINGLISRLPRGLPAPGGRAV